MIVAERIKALRKERKVSQQEVASYLGLSLTGYANYEQGRRYPSFDKLIKLSDYYDVSLDYLVGRSDIPHTKSEGEFVEDLKHKSIEELVKEYNLALGDKAMTSDEEKTLIRLMKAYLEKD